MALLDHTIKNETSLSETSGVLLLGLWPPLGEGSTTRLVRELDRDRILHVNLALEVDNGVRVRDFLLLGDEIGVHASFAEHCLELLQGQLPERFRVRQNRL